MENGMPQCNIFKATSPLKIIQDINNYPVGRNIYVCMAQPLEEGAPSFCIQYFCSDNRFSTQDVSNRWDYFDREFSAEGVRVVGKSTDGDPRAIGAMLDGMEMPHLVQSIYGEHFCAKAHIKSVLLQDPTHTTNKLRVKVLKKDAELILGNYKVSRVHLEQLIDRIDKTVHGLSATDINESDKMKFQPAEKMAQQRVIDALHDEIPDSDATVLYLTMMKDIMEVFIKNSSRDVVSPTEAVVKIWHVVFVLRAWRNYCVRKFNGLKHTVTTNTYWCVELNAHSLVNYIALCREEDLQYLPDLLQSQTCEGFFRTARSFTSTESTVVNFTMKGFETKLNRIQAKTDVSHDKTHGFSFRRVDKKIDQPKRNCTLPTTSEIRELIESARDQAYSELIRLGLDDAEIDFKESILLRPRASRNKNSETGHYEFVDAGSFEPDDEESDGENEEESLHPDIRKHTDQRRLRILNLLMLRPWTSMERKIWIQLDVQMMTA
ncbi:uncharacterized protein LOC119769938 [Culex quinquefasciatus]|uniref:uncharacterized protein LOC119769938 n=1 Tax=Culex quinquefasciatus TaxID=7176 RepID=UPI0018E39C27|nr:uncharacterized protein LOC119769938 [Culex quinquefasciatus]